jgi:hypothetical protein
MATTPMSKENDRISHLISGLKKHFPTGSTPLQIGGVNYTADSLATLLQGVIDVRADVQLARAGLSAKVQAERAQATHVRGVMHSLVAYVRGTFGTSADALGDFGLAPPKTPTPPKAEAKAVAVAKRAATRKARGTMGKVAKKSVKGAVTATLVVTPSPEPPPTGASIATPTATPPVAPATPSASSGAPQAVAPAHAT